MSFLSC